MHLDFFPKFPPFTAALPMHSHLARACPSIDTNWLILLSIFIVNVIQSNHMCLTFTFTSVLFYPQVILQFLSFLWNEVNRQNKSSLLLWSSQEMQIVCDSSHYSHCSWKMHLQNRTVFIFGIFSYRHGWICTCGILNPSQRPNSSCCLCQDNLPSAL